MPLAQAQLVAKKCKRKPRRVLYVPKKQPKTFTVHSVLAKRSTEGGTEYFVQWLRYGSGASSWIRELPSAFEAAWGDGSDKPYTTTADGWDALVNLACGELLALNRE